MATRLGLDSFSPAQLTALRFLIAAVPALVLPRPRLAWSTLVAIGLTLYAGQFLLQFFAIANGLPPGLASLLVQTQALFTILFAAMVLRETPTRRQLLGVALAFAGLVLIVLTIGHDLTAVGFGLALGSAISWGVGNVLLKRIRDVDMLDLVVWLSLVPPLPALALSLIVDGPPALVRSAARGAWISVSWVGVVSVLYLGLVATILAYAIWGRLLRRYPAATVTPFALLVPFVGAYSSALVFGERFGALRLAGMALVLLGIAVIVLSARASRRMAAGDDHTLSVVPATRADAPGVVDLIGRVYAEYRFVYEPRAEVPDLFRFDEHYAPPRGAFWVVRDGGRVVGSVGVERLDGAAAELHRLYLDAHLRGRGTGRALVEAVLAWCRAEKISRLILWSDTRFDQAHRLYERMGFEQRGERTLPDDLNQTREYGFERPV
ncbi:MAG: hypothetical protein DME04_04515 [Candidatus Rokuibacteriota bacterium]|nr:MAG: hypothetical protein DME04_04515 [Candidatus Rokubacteria bacterium]